jgi:hypothetical protein
MKLRFGRFSLVTCCFLTATVLMAAQTTPVAVNADTVTVGDFVVRLADALNPAHRDIKSLDQAKQFFAGQGILIPANINLSAPLTQADVATVTSLIGVSVSANEPTEPFQGPAVDNFVGYLRQGIQDGRLPLGGSDGTTPTLTINVSTGACCEAGSCTLLDKSNCAAAGGIWRGLGVPCDPNPCGAEYSRCCVSRHDCRILTFADCNSVGGIFTGGDSCHPPGLACKNPEPSVTPTEP